MSEHGHIKFWQEIGRRNVLRVAAVYVGFSWAVVHSGVVVGEALELPHWIMRFVSAVLIVGFPAVVAFAWVYEITPEGLKRTEEVEKNASITHRTAQRLNVVLIVLVAILIGLYGADRFLPRHEAAEAVHIAADAAPKALAGEGVSIAVLPFLNLSSDKEQEFFSDGVTEEITSALAEVKGLRVVGRTSAFEFKGQNKDLRAIGQALGVTNLLEGSVRKAGNRVRITGQLIRATDGSHIWTKDYDRELTDIFKTQDEIAQAIAAALQVPLGLKPDESLVASRAIDPDSHQQYLRAAALFRTRGTSGNPVTAAVGLLEQVVARNPDYAPAWALLAHAYADAPQEAGNYGPSGSAAELRAVADAFLAKAEAAGAQALKLDPTNPDSYGAAANPRIFRGRYIEMEDLFRQALKLDPLSPDALHGLSQQLMSLGRLKEAAPMREQISALEPLVPRYNIDTARARLYLGDREAALAILKALPANYGQRAEELAATYASMGRYGEAADAVLTAPQGRFRPGVVEQAAKLLRMAPTRVAPQDLPDFPAQLAFVYLAVGASDRVVKSALDDMQLTFDRGYFAGPGTRILANPVYAPARKTERFKALARSFGWVDSWRARGWPDVCHPVGNDDFECS